MKKSKKIRKASEKAEIKEENGLNISYDKNEFNHQFPHLIEEISSKKKSIKINSINTDLDQESPQTSQDLRTMYPKELYNPGALDFIRRCTKKEEAVDILDYLLKRREISPDEYNHYKKIVMQEDGLTKLINQSGGQKLPGYYLDKYYFKDNKNQKLNSTDD